MSDQKSLLDLDSYRPDPGKDLDLATLFRLIEKTAAAVVGLHQVIVVLQSQIETLALKSENTERILTSVEDKSMSLLESVRVSEEVQNSNLKKLNDDISEVKSLLLQVADHIGVPHA
jgi:hypothetical protein